MATPKHIKVSRAKPGSSNWTTSIHDAPAHTVPKEASLTNRKIVNKGVLDHTPKSSTNTRTNFVYGEQAKKVTGTTNKQARTTTSTSATSVSQINRPMKGQKGLTLSSSRISILQKRTHNASRQLGRAGAADAADAASAASAAIKRATSSPVSKVARGAGAVGAITAGADAMKFSTNAGYKAGKALRATVDSAKTEAGERKAKKTLQKAARSK